MTGEEELAVRQARGAADAARDFLREYWIDDARGGHLMPQPCAWGDDAWHRAVTRLIQLHRPDYRRLLAEERGKTPPPVVYDPSIGEQP